MLMGGDFSCTLVLRLDRSFVPPVGRHDFLALSRLLARAQMSDVLEDEMERAVVERELSAFHAAAHTYFYNLTGGGFASSRLDWCSVSDLHPKWIRDVVLSVS